jgi:hydrogenase nickel incorporation protein HypA/HybF
MHELSIADSVVRIACAHAGERRVVKVELQLGYLRQVVPSALAFAFTLVAEGTAAEGAELVMEEIPAAGVCRACGTESDLDGFPLACPHCGSLDLELIRGEELLVDSLELEGAMTTATVADSYPGSGQLSQRGVTRGD